MERGWVEKYTERSNQSPKKVSRCLDISEGVRLMRLKVKGGVDLRVADG